MRTEKEVRIVIMDLECPKCKSDNVMGDRTEFLCLDCRIQFLKAMGRTLQSPRLTEDEFEKIRRKIIRKMDEK